MVGGGGGGGGGGQVSDSRATWHCLLDPQALSLGRVFAPTMVGRASTSAMGHHVHGAAAAAAAAAAVRVLSPLMFAAECPPRQLSLVGWL
eukprot:COSAG01_NODE_6396_length_3689_cov_1.935376_6_plen_90_part_00